MHIYKSWNVARLPIPSPGSDLPTTLMARKDRDTMKTQAGRPKRSPCDRMPRAELVWAPGLCASPIYSVSTWRGIQRDGISRENKSHRQHCAQRNDLGKDQSMVESHLIGDKMWEGSNI